MKLLEHVYDELAELSWHFTYREFSRIYLGRCGSYYSYLKSTGKPPSAGVLLNLWRELIKEREKYAHLMSHSQNTQEQEVFGDWIAVYERLSGDVFSSLKEHSGS